MALWITLRLTIQAHVIPIVDPGVSLTFLWSEFAAVALIKLWRMVRPYREKKEKFDWQQWQLNQNRNKMFDLD